MKAHKKQRHEGTQAPEARQARKKMKARKTCKK